MTETKFKKMLRQKQIDRYKVLLDNAISYICESTGESDDMWLENTIGITKSELNELNSFSKTGKHQ